MVLFQVASRHLGRDNPSHADVPIVEYFLNRANGSFGGVVPNRSREQGPVGVGAAGLVCDGPVLASCNATPHRARQFSAVVRMLQTGRGPARNRLPNGGLTSAATPRTN